MIRLWKSYRDNNLGRETVGKGGGMVLAEGNGLYRENEKKERRPPMFVCVCVCVCVCVLCKCDYKCVCVCVLRDVFMCLCV